jgi:hypothetical protein
MFWLLTLPFRIALGLLFGLVALPFALALFPLALIALPFVLLFWLPFAILRVTLKLIVLPVVLLCAAIGLLAGGIALLAPLIPLAILGGGLWLLWRLISGPSNAPVRF